MPSPARLYSRKGKSDANRGTGRCASIVPIVVLENNNDAIPLAETLVVAGLTVIEVTLRTSGALRSIDVIASSVQEMTVGVGSL